ncbi:type I-E CRISPR-associated protein Cas5/CasD [Methylohalobius crimeensis]|uniref:type I-E CRISPR-associated protein Cas5/CasD n=1 Tax=Methylohalobius crimeensis TaxID=244365 RepID=UPI0003B56FE3|nr:type I-E CRISPR-associated protein Cas5/CasD [Methylohalobius crimeensis]
MKALVLRLDAPMMSFGGVIIDQHGFIERFPGQAMLTGLLANALGWHHGDFDRLENLQRRLRYAARWDVKPERVVDYHTVDLSQPKMSKPGWTTRGNPEHRAGGQSAKFGTHQRYRHYWMDGLMTLVLTLEGSGNPDLTFLLSALHHPARPLFLGRKACIPSRPLFDPETPLAEGPDLLHILRQLPRWNRHGEKTDQADMEACWPAELDIHEREETRRVYDLRDWANQLPAGSRLRTEGLLQEGDSCT